MTLGNNIRRTIVGRRPAVFVSDLVDLYGNGVVSRIGNKNIFSQRVAHNGNSQTRRLVYSSVLTNAMLNGPAQPKRKVAGRKKSA